MKKIILLLLITISLTACSKDEPKIVQTPAVDTIEVYSEFTPATCYLETDSGKYQMKMTENNVDTQNIGNYLVTYEYTYEEVLYTCERMIFVTDSISPVVELLAGIDTISANSTWIDGSVTYSDNYSTDLTLTIENNVDTTTPGSYTVIYTVTDEFSNKTVRTRIVTVTN